MVIADVGIVVVNVAVVNRGVDVVVLVVVVVVVVVEVDVGVGTKIVEVDVIVDGVVVVDDFAEQEQETGMTMVNPIINAIARQ